MRSVHSGEKLCEVGAGKSLAAEYLLKNKLPLQNLLITDESACMLEYSRPFSGDGALLKVAPADHIPLQSDCVDWLISSLGDPYNTDAFWTEVARILKAGGRAIFTIPAYEWAKHFRRDEKDQIFENAEFELMDGRHVFLPSFIYPQHVQEERIRSAGLAVVEIRQTTIGDLNGEKLSPKLGFNRGRMGPVVTGYLLQKKQP